jgi:ATP-binding cassette subfamily F protein 3
MARDLAVNFTTHSAKARAAVIVSHDRVFLDQVATAILEIDPTTHHLRVFPGNYSAYLETRLAEQNRHWQEYTDQQAEIQRLRKAAAHFRGLARFRKGGKADTGDKFAKGFFANRGKETVKKAKNVERRLEHLLTDERIDKPRQGWQMKIDFSDIPASSRAVLALEGLSVGYPGIMLMKDLDLQVGFGERVVLVGPNGSGKTTLLKTIAGHIPPLAGRVRLGPSVRVGYMAQEQENLAPEEDALTALRHWTSLPETEARAFLHQYLFSGDEVFTPIQKLSYGERARLSLACLVAQGCNLLLLDEPINHLDIPSRARFEHALAHFEATILAVVHDRYFISGFARSLWFVQDGEILRQ